MGCVFMKKTVLLLLFTFILCGCSKTEGNVDANMVDMSDEEFVSLLFSRQLEDSEYEGGTSTWMPVTEDEQYKNIRVQFIRVNDIYSQNWYLDNGDPNGFIEVYFDQMAFDAPFVYYGSNFVIPLTRDSPEVFEKEEPYTVEEQRFDVLKVDGEYRLRCFPRTPKGTPTKEMEFIKIEKK